MAREVNPVPPAPPPLNSADTNIAIPNQFSSKTFNPATTAAEIGSRTVEERAGARTDLLQYRKQLEESLAENVPPWPEFKAIVEGLSASLLLTQNATSLSTDVRDLAFGANESTRPQIIVEALHETERIASNLRLLEQVKSISLQMRELREREATIPVSEHFTSHGHSIATIFEHSNAHLTRSSALDPRSVTTLQPDYVGRAREIADMRTSAFRQHLLSVEALNPIRVELEQRHHKMRTELEVLLLYGVYGVTESAPSSELFNPTTQSSRKSRFSRCLDEDSDGFVGRSFLPAMPLFPGIEGGAAKPNPLGFAELGMSMQDALPQIVQALDTLCGAGHACHTIEKITVREAQAVIEHALRTELQIAKAASPSEQPATSDFDDKGAEQNCGSFFRMKEPSETEKLCCATLNRICYHFSATLRRLVGLANAMERGSVCLFSSISSTREQMEHGLIFVLNHFLGTKGGASVAETLEPGPGIERVFSLLANPRSSTGSIGAASNGESSTTNPRYSTLSDMERRSPLAWNIRAMHELPENMKCSIFNLELIHSILKRFSREAERLLAPWYGFGKGKGLTSRTLVNPLDDYLHHTTANFVQTLRQDLRQYIRAVVGKRAGSLLQPPPLKSRNSQSDPRSFSIPPSRHVEPVAQIIAVFLRIAISIPDIAQEIGAIVSSEVLLVLKVRSRDALKLARKWTDAGFLLQDVEDQWGSEIGLEGDTRPARPRAPLAHSVASSDELCDVEPIVSNLISIVDGLIRDGSSGPTLLSENEWKAVVRLIQGLNSISDELQKWFTDSKLSQTAGLDTSVTGRWSDMLASRASCMYPLQQLRQRIRQVSTGTEFAMLSTVRAALEQMEGGLCALRSHVVAPCAALLRAEVMLRCYWLSVRSMREIETAFIAPRRPLAVLAGKPAWGHYATDVEMEDCDDAPRDSDEPPSRLFEFDEYGDRIPQSSNCIVQDAFAQSAGAELVLDAQSLTKAENRMVAFAKRENAHLATRFGITKTALPTTQVEDIFSGVDLAIAEGLRNVRRKDRAIAVASRMLAQTLALEEQSLIGDRTAEQCRALMYASGML